MRLSIGVLLLACACGLACAGDVTKWEEHSSKEGRFTAAFPEAPVQTAGVVLVPKKETRPYWVMVNYVAAGMDLTDKKSAREYLLGGQKGTTDQAQGEVINEKEFEFGGRPAREFSFASTKYGKVRCRLILADGDKERSSLLYHLSFFADSEEMLVSKEAERFFESFKLMSAASPADPPDQTAFNQGYENAPSIMIAATIIAVCIFGLYHLIRYVRAKTN